MRLLPLLLLLACAEREPASVAVERAAPPLPGAELLRVSAPEVDARQRFSAADPLVFELTIPPGPTIPGRGLPPDVPGAGELGEAYQDNNERSIVQIELPVSRHGTTDEEQMMGSVGQFDPPRFCRVGDPACLWGDDDDGRWRAWRVRDEGAGEVVTELQLAHTWIDPMELNPSPSWRILGLWMPTADAPLDAFDRLRFEYVGHVPRKSTDWTSDDPEPRPFRPRLRYRPASTDPLQDCPGTEPSCWVLLDTSDVQPMEIHAGPATWLSITAPFDTPLGANTAARLVFLDRWMNPSRVTGDVQLTASGRAIGQPLHLTNAWRAQATIPAQRAGVFRLAASTTLPVEVRGQYLRVWGSAPPYQHKVGDVHIHTGGDGALAFSRSAIHGDHRGNFVRNTDALRYLQEVAGLDFGAVSEHAILSDGWTPPGGMPLFGPGGACEVDAVIEPDAGDWWTASQEASLAYQQDHPGFVTYPAYEWHGAMNTATIDAPLHRIVLYRDHDTTTPFGLPMLPGNVRNRAPACLFRWLDDLGSTNQDVLVLPHMMFANPQNSDWQVTYQPSPPWDAVATGDRAQHYQRVGEIYSSRNLSEDIPGITHFATFEGIETPGAQAPFTWRTGWRDTAAIIGVIGASDNHVGMPGSNDFDPSHPDAATHEPGGYAFVLATSNTRDGIYEAMQQRHTYATSGVRAMLDWRVSDRSHTWTMGDEIQAGTACELTTEIDLAVAQNIRTLAIWADEVGSNRTWTSPYFRQPVNREVVHTSSLLRNPVPAGGGTRTYVYYVRAFTGPHLTPGTPAIEVSQGHEEAVWSSPVWVTWTGARCP